MPPRIEYKCCVCQECHPRQAFISHAGKDKAIAKEAAKACCAAQVKPYLFEYSDEFSQPAIDNARTIANEINNSDIFLVVLSQSVSRAFWTQAWIGFEIGVSIGVDLTASGPEKKNYLSSKVFVLQDIHQAIKVSVPRVDVLFLFDFARNWDDASDLLVFISTYLSESTSEVFRRGNELRERMMTGGVACANEKCKGIYDVVMPVKDTKELGFKIWWNKIQLKSIRWIEKGLRAKSTLKCPSCGEKVNCDLTRSL